MNLAATLKASTTLPARVVQTWTRTRTLRLAAVLIPAAVMATWIPGAGHSITETLILACMCVSYAVLMLLAARQMDTMARMEAAHAQTRQAFKLTSDTLIHRRRPEPGRFKCPCGGGCGED